MNWAYNLDMLAQNGVLDYDGASYIMGQNPRYIGSPTPSTSPYAGQLPPAPNLNQPQADEFKQNPAQPPENKKENNYIKNPGWKKWAFGALALGGLIFGGIKLKGVFKKVKPKVKSKGKFADFKKSVGNFFKNTGEFIKKYWNKFLNLLRKNKKP